MDWSLCILCFRVCCWLFIISLLHLALNTTPCDTDYGKPLFNENSTTCMGTCWGCLQHTLWLHWCLCTTWMWWSQSSQTWPAWRPFKGLLSQWNSTLRGWCSNLSAMTKKGAGPFQCRGVLWFRYSVGCFRLGRWKCLPEHSWIGTEEQITLLTHSTPALLVETHVRSHLSFTCQMQNWIPR